MPGTSSALCTRINNYSWSSRDAWVFTMDPVPGSDFCQPGERGYWMPTESTPSVSFSLVDLFWVCQFKVFARRFLRACSSGVFGSPWTLWRALSSRWTYYRPWSGLCALCPWDSLQESGAGFVSVGLSDFTLGERERGEKTPQKKPPQTQNLSLWKGRNAHKSYVSFIQ